MRIFEFVPEHLIAPQVGISRYVYDLSNELAAHGHDVRVIAPPCPIPHGQLPGCNFQLHAIGAKMPPLNSPDPLRDVNTFLMVEAIRVNEAVGRPDILHVHGRFSAFLAAGLKDLWGTPVVVTCHYLESGLAAIAGNPDPANSYKGRLERWLFGLADIVICPSQFIYHQLREKCRIPSPKLIVIPNGGRVCDTNVTEEIGHIRKLLSGGSENVVLYAGRLSPEKGPQILLEAASQLLHRSACPRLVFAGSGSQRNELFNLARRLGLSEQVVFTGHLAPPELFQLFAVCDLLVMPSLYEVFGLVALEAMSCDVPIVASDVGGLSELLSHEESALLVPPGDAKALSIAIEQVLADNELATRLKRGARQRVETQFSWDVVLPQIEAAFSQLIHAAATNTEATPAEVVDPAEIAI